MIRLIRFLLLCGTGLFAAPAAFAGLLDPSFANEGVRVLDFSATPGASGEERGVVNCAAAGGKQLVVASDDYFGLVVTRLNFDGSVDTGFGVAGTRVHAMAAGNLLGPHTGAVCRADGGIWIVTTQFVPNANWRIRLIALDADGLLVPGGAFGPHGHADIEIPAPGSLFVRQALGFNQAPDGRAFATGFVETSANQYSPWLIALEADGDLQGVSVFRPQDINGSIVATAAGVGPGGGIWVAGSGEGPGALRAAFRAYFDPATLALVHAETFALAGQSIDVAGGSMVRHGVMVVGAARRTPGAPASPMLLVMRTEGQITMLDLPSPAPMEDGGHTGISAAGQPISSLQGGRVLYGIGAEAWSASMFQGYKGWYFARAVIGASAAGDQVDTSFGDGGQAVLSVRSGETDCDGLLNTQTHARAGIWLGRPTVIGWWSRHCDPQQEWDGLLMRLEPDDAIFADGFE